VKPANRPSGPHGRLLFGHLRDFGDDPLEFLSGVAREHGPVAALRFGRTRAFLLSDPSLIEEVMVTRRMSFVKSPALRAQRRLLGNGLLMNEGDSWLRQRRLAQPAFHRNRIAAYADVIVDHSSRFVDSLQPGSVVEIHERFKALTIGIASTALFGADVAHRASAVGPAIEDTMTRYASRRGLARLVPDWFPLPVNNAYRKGVEEIEDTVLDIIAARRADGTQREDLLSMLMEAEYENGEAMTDRQLRDEAVTLFLAGIDTPSLALSWCWYLLSEHPEAQRSMANEVDSVLGDRRATISDFRSLSYTEMVVNEALRLFPPAWLLTREAIERVTIGETEIPAGAVVFMSPWVAHRDPHYFPNPLCFDPDRWRNGTAASLPRFAYFPFGGGPRVCIGAAFAMTEMVLCLATIAQRLRFRLADGARVVPHPSMTLRPRDGVPVIIEPRPAVL
jgi:cytochrome P450